MLRKLTWPLQAIELSQRLRYLYGSRSIVFTSLRSASQGRNTTDNQVDMNVDMADHQMTALSTLEYQQIREPDPVYALEGLTLTQNDGISLDDDLPSLCSTVSSLDLPGS